MSNKIKKAGTAKTENELESNVGEILSKSEQFIENNKKNIIIGLISIVVIVVAILGVRHGYLLPKEEKAQKEIFRGEFFLQNSEWDKALYGDSAQFIGFEAIISEYGLTQTGNLAKGYAGICYYHKGDYDKAISYLKKFNASDKTVSPVLTGLIGDCYVSMEKPKDAINYFLKAANKANDNLISPIYLKKAGRVYDSLGEYKKAAEIYTSIKDKYPASVEAQDIDKFIDRSKSKI